MNSILSGAALRGLVPHNFWDGEADAPVLKKNKISICTTVMNRLGDLKQTLGKNIADNLAYKNIEWVILDYNSDIDEVRPWVKIEFGDLVVLGIVKVYRSVGHDFYSMAHSRNIAFKSATGDIVLNVDADNYTNEGFAEYINLLANQVPEKCIFAKGKKMLRGRLGFYRSEFTDILGGYNEQLVGYGHDDHDLLNRAWCSGMKMTWFGGEYYSNTGSPKHDTGNYANNEWKYTEKMNKIISWANISMRRYKANLGYDWGKGNLV